MARVSVEEWQRARRLDTPTPLALICVLALFPSLFLTGFIAAAAHWAFWVWAGHLVVLTVTPAAVVGVIRLVEGVVRHRLPRGGAWALVVGTSIAMFVVMAVTAGDGDRRCVDTASMTVAASHECDDTTPGFAWYYGGSGANAGDPAAGGSFTAPGDDGSDGGGGAGDDGGGGEGGGEGGGGE